VSAFSASVVAIKFNVSATHLLCGGKYTSGSKSTSGFDRMVVISFGSTSDRTAKSFAVCIICS